MAAKKAAPSSTNLTGSNYVILLLLGALLALGITALISKSLISAAVTETKAFSAKRLASSQLDTNLVAAPKLISAYQALGDDTRTKLADSLPASEDYPSLIGAFENMARTTGVLLTAVSRSTNQVGLSVAPPTSHTVQPQSVPVSVSATGDFASIQKFIAAIEASSRPMKVTAMQMTGSASTITTQLDITTYYEEASKVPFEKQDLK